MVLSYLGASGVGGIIVFLLIKSFVPSYLAEKGKNLATREDIAKITEPIEKIKSGYALIQEELKAHHQLRLAALDRRLEAHQEAFTLWREIMKSVHTEEIGKTAQKCEAWWEKNCLYLESKVRGAFVVAYDSALSHHAYVQALADSKIITENWERITNFPNIVFEAVQLPPLSEAETKALKASSRTATGTRGPD